MSDFRQLSETVWASPQIDVADVATAADLGFTMVVNNRPDGEAHDQPEGAAIEQAALAAGLQYLAIPIGQAGFGEPQVAAMADAISDAANSASGGAGGKVLAYCRSGTRSTFLWSLAQATQGASPDAITASAAKAGYDVSPIRGGLDILAAKARV